jgi:anti-anti-sigma regulatory factor
MFRADRSAEARICLLDLEGSLSSSDLVNLSERLRGLAARGVLRVVVDLRQVDHWDYRGLHCLAEAVSYRRNAGGVTAFITPSRYLRSIAGAAGVHDDLDFYDDLKVEEEVQRVQLAVVELKSEPEDFRQASGL